MNKFMMELDETNKPFLYVQGQCGENQGISYFNGIRIINPGYFNLGKFAIVNFGTADGIFKEKNIEFYDI